VNKGFLKNFRALRHSLLGENTFTQDIILIKKGKYEMSGFYATPF
jgi:hypothetical protein